MSTLHVLNHYSKFIDDLKNKKTFLIDTSINYYKDISKMEIIEQKSLFSYLFEIKDYYPQHIIDKLYVCRCEKLTGQKYEGMVCPNCGEAVKKIESTSATIAYIQLPRDIKVLTPLGLMYLQKIIGKDTYTKFLNGDLKIADKKYKDTNYIYDHFDMLIETYKTKSGNKDKYIKFMKEEKENIFTSLIPVISSKVRFINITENMGVKNIGLHGLNEPYAKISVATERLKTCLNDNTPGKLRKTVYDIQKNVHELKEALIIEFADDKKKMMRDAIFGTRVGFTSMAVLAPLTTYAELDSCTIPIETFRSNFKDDIKKIMLSMGYSLIYVTKFLDTNYFLNAEDKELLKAIFKQIENPFIYVNRQPTIDFESIMTLHIREIKDELVLRIHPNLLDGFRGDHDGDTLIMVGLDVTIREEFHNKLGPMMFITSFNGTFNTTFSLKNDIQTLYCMSAETDDKDVIILDMKRK